MTLSTYHQKYADLPKDDIQKRIDAKLLELETIFSETALNTEGDVIRIAVLGCGDKRFVTQHKNIFEKVLGKTVDIATFDISIEHLEGEPGVIAHDCTLPLPNQPYDITYSHVLLKFIAPEKQLAIIMNSYNALKPGGLAIHCFDNEELVATEKQLSDGRWAVPLEALEKELNKNEIDFKEVSLKYGPALIIMK